MPDALDPFRHHPRLRDLIKPPEQSFFRSVDPEKIKEMVKSHGGDPSFILGDQYRHVCREAALLGRRDDDLWVFAYGSLIWDPAIKFTEVRRAFAPTVERKFILRDTNGGRGNQENPGVMAALDWGAGCHGVVFRIARAEIEEETHRLWQRERIGSAYLPGFIPTETDHGPIEALTFLADHEADIIAADLSHEDQVKFCATGKGFLGTSLEYVENLAKHFETFGIDDPTVTRLWKEAKAYRGD